MNPPATTAPRPGPLLDPQAVARLEILRRAARRRQRLAVALFVLSFPVAIAAYQLKEIAFLLGLVMPVVIVIGALLARILWGEKTAESYHAAYREQIVPGILATLDPQAAYRTDSLPREAFDATGLFPRDYNGYYGGGSISGSHGGLSYTSYPLRVELDRDPRTRTRTAIFYGTLQMLSLPAPLRGTTIFTPRRDSMFKGLAGGGEKPAPGVLEIPDEAFAARYTVTTDLPEEARHLLHPAFREVMLRLDQRFPAGVHARFHGGTLVLALRHHAQLLMADEKTPVDDPRQSLDVENYLHGTLAVPAWVFPTLSGSGSDRNV